MKKSKLKIKAYYSCEARQDPEEARACNWSEYLTGTGPTFNPNGQATCPQCNRPAFKENWLYNPLETAA